MNKKVRNLALRGLLSMKAQENKILGLDAFDTKEPKTKLAVDVLKNIGLDNKKVLFVLGTKNDATEKSFRNIKNLKYIHANYLNPADLMKYDTVLMLEDALTHINTK